MTAPDLQAAASHETWTALRRRAFLWVAPFGLAGCAAGVAFQLPDVGPVDRVMLPALGLALTVSAVLVGLRRMHVETALGLVYAVSVAYFLVMLAFEYGTNVGRDTRMTEAAYYLPVLYTLAFVTWPRARANLFASATLAAIVVLTVGFVPTFAERGQWNARLFSILTHFLLSQVVLVAFLGTLAYLLERFAALRALVYVDGLTGLPNRRYAEEHADAARRAPGEPLAVAMFDIDHFKRVNDRFGHHVGDAVLREVGAVSARHVAALVPTRRAFVCRWGGEEFVAVLPGLREDDARLLLDGLRDALRRHDFGEVGPVTVSGGVALVGAQETFGGALVRADAALYAAKHGGRDRVVAASDVEAATAGDVPDVL